MGILRAKVGGQWVDVYVGAPGPPGADAGPNSYVHVQGTAASTWTINHNLGWYPNVTVIDSGLSEVEGDITQISVNTVRVQFSASFAGTAYLS